MSFNESSAERTRRARAVAQLRLFTARICYAERWIMYGFHSLRHGRGAASCRASCRWPADPTLAADATTTYRGK